MLTLISPFKHSRQIEDALTGRIYDPYIRLLLWEGVRSWWRDSLPTWLSCSREFNVDADNNPSAGSSFPASEGVNQLTFRAEADGSARKAVICPFAWASETHRTTCALGFPANYDDELLLDNELSAVLDEPNDDAASSMTTGRLLEVGGQSPFYLKIRSTLLAFSPAS